MVAEITGKGGKAIAVKGDVSKAADVKRLFAETKKTFGAPDVLVNNAGIYAFEPLGRSRRTNSIASSTPASSDRS